MYSFIVIHFTVTGERRHSADLAQGGLEVPCKLKFDGPNKALELCKSDLVSNTKYLYSIVFYDSKSHVFVFVLEIHLGIMHLKNSTKNICAFLPLLHQSKEYSVLLERFSDQKDVAYVIKHLSN